MTGFMSDAAARACALYGASALVFAALVGLGRVPGHFIERGHRSVGLLRLPLHAVSGWGIAALLGALGAVVGIDQTGLSRGMLGLGLLLLVPLPGAGLRPGWLLLRDLAVLLVLVAPMGLLVAATPATAFDEFAQWLPNTRYLVEHARYWLWPDWVGLSSKPGYPNGSVTIALLASQFAGPSVEAPFKIFGVILLGAFGAVLAHLVAGSGGASHRRTLMLLGAGCLVAFTEPLFDPRVGLTALTDMPSGVVLAVAGLVASLGIGAARRGRRAVAASWFAWGGLLSLTLVMLRTTNLVLVAAIGLACIVLLSAARIRPSRAMALWAALLIGPCLVGLLVWHAYLSVAGIGPDIAPRDLTAWDWTAPVTVARAFLLDRLLGQPLLGVGALGCVAVTLLGGVILWQRLDDPGTEDRPSPRLLLGLTAIVGLLFILFLAWSYMAVFSAEEVARAASLWRYLTELGPLILLAAGSAALSLLPQGPTAPWRRRVLASAGIGACILTLLLPVVGRRYYGLDCRYPDVVAARDVAGALRTALGSIRSDGAVPRVVIVHPTMGDWMAFAIAFDLRWPDSDRLVLFRKTEAPLSETERWAWDNGYDAVLDLTPLDRAALTARPIVPAVTLFGRPEARGETWRSLAVTAPQPLSSCAARSGE